MSTLPILVAWGHVISKLVLGGIAGGALLAYRAIRNRSDLAPARADVRRMSASVDHPREGPIAIRGTYHSVDGERWIDCEGERVVLAANAVIIRGSSARWNQGTRTYAISDGDLVVALGRMSRTPTTAETGYREAAGGWQLEPSAGETAIEMCAAVPVACPRPLWPVRGVLVLGLVGTAAYYGLGYLGHKLVAKRDYNRGSHASTLASEIACALPQARDEALRRYEIDLHYLPQTDRVIEQQLELAHMTDCRSEAYLLQQFGRHEAAVETARDCGHLDDARGSLLILARYDEAAQPTPDSQRAFGPHQRSFALVGAGRWHEAAVSLEEWQRDYAKDHKGERDDGVTCIVKYLHGLAKEDAPERPEGASRDSTCRAIDLVTLDDYHERDAIDVELDVAVWLSGHDPSAYSVFESGPVAWLAPFAREQDSSLTHYRRAQLELLLGRHDRAVAELAKARELRPSAEAGDRWARMDTQLDRIVALRSGAPIAELHDPLEPGERPDVAALLRSGARDIPPDALGGCRESASGAFAAALAGDGLPLAEALAECRDRPSAIPLDYVLGVATHVTHHREELAASVRNSPPGGQSLAVLDSIALHRDIARILGDTAEATRMQGIIDAHAVVMSDRDRALALWLVSKKLAIYF